MRSPPEVLRFEVSIFRDFEISRPRDLEIPRLEIRDRLVNPVRTSWFVLRVFLRVFAGVLCVILRVYLRNFGAIRVFCACFARFCVISRVRVCVFMRVFAAKSARHHGVRFVCCGLSLLPLLLMLLLLLLH